MTAADRCKLYESKMADEKQEDESIFDQNEEPQLPPSPSPSPPSQERTPEEGKKLRLRDLMRRQRRDSDVSLIFVSFFR